MLFMQNISDFSESFLHKLTPKEIDTKESIGSPSGAKCIAFEIVQSLVSIGPIPYEQLRSKTLIRGGNYVPAEIQGRSSFARRSASEGSTWNRGRVLMDVRGSVYLSYGSRQSSYISTYGFGTSVCF